MMKIEIEKDFPQYFKPAYPEEFELFSHFEVTAGIPTVLFAVTTWKENGKPNVCFHSWSCFHGDKTAFFAVMGEYSGLGDTTVRSFGNRYSGIKETAIPVLETNHIVP